MHKQLQSKLLPNVLFSFQKEILAVILAFERETGIIDEHHANSKGYGVHENIIEQHASN